MCARPALAAANLPFRLACFPAILCHSLGCSLVQPLGNLSMHYSLIFSPQLAHVQHVIGSRALHFLFKHLNLCSFSLSVDLCFLLVEGAALVCSQTEHVKKACSHLALLDTVAFDMILCRVRFSNVSWQVLHFHALILVRALHFLFLHVILTATLADAHKMPPLVASRIDRLWSIGSMKTMKL